jgi:hypothetical protein
MVQGGSALLPPATPTPDASGSGPLSELAQAAGITPQDVARVLDYAEDGRPIIKMIDDRGGEHGREAPAHLLRAVPVRCGESRMIERDLVGVASALRGKAVLRQPELHAEPQKE